MKENKLYRIDIFGLKFGVHDFQFKFDQKIFENKEDSVIESGSGYCKIVLDKKERLISINFEINGAIDLICDRSLESFKQPIDLKENLILNYGEAFDDSRDDMWIIPDTQESINIERSIYEYLTLAVPMKKLHPKFAELEEEESDDELELVYSSEEDEEDKPDSKEDNEVMDPRWEALKNIKNLGN